MRSVDFHAHLRREAGSAEKLLSLMDALEIERAIVVPGGSLSPEALANGISLGGERNVFIDNASLISNTANSANRLIPFYFGNPHESPVEYASAALYQVARGLKLGPAVHGVALGDPRNLAWIEAARLRRHPIYLHCLGRVGFDVPDLTALAQRFPELTFILGHAGVGNADFRAVAQIAPYENIHFETSGGFSSVIQFAIDRLGAHRVLFGSEYSLQDPAVELLKIKRLNLSHSAQAQVLCANALALVGEEQNHA